MSAHTPDRKDTLGIVGVGVMGGGIAANLLKGGSTLVVYEMNPARVQHFASLGAYAASSAADVARQASTLISMVETTAQSEEVIMGPEGFQSTAQAGDVILSMATIDPLAVKEWHKVLRPAVSTWSMRRSAAGRSGPKAATSLLYVAAMRMWWSGSSRYSIPAPARCSIWAKWVRAWP